MKKSPEPIILAAALAFLALGSAGLAFYFPTLEEITGVHDMNPKGHASKKLNADDLQSSVAIWNTPALWTEPASHHPLFNSDNYLFYPSLYPSGNYLVPLDEKARSPGGVLLSWYKKYGIDFTTAGVDREDPDNDGFSNIVEFKNEKVGEHLNAADLDGSNSTNPLDAKSHPDYLARLRLQKYETTPFHIQFKGYQELNGEYVFQIRLSDEPSSSQPPLKKSGDPLGFEGYIVGAFHLNIVNEKDPGTGLVEPVDESTLELDKPEIDLKVTVPFRKEIDSPESTADFVMLMPSESDKVIKVSRGKIFSLSYIADTQYLVLDAKDDGATIRDTKTKQDYHIPKLDPAEWDEVPQPASAPKTP